MGIPKAWLRWELSGSLTGKSSPHPNWLKSLYHPPQQQPFKDPLVIVDSFCNIDLYYFFLFLLYFCTWIRIYNKKIKYLTAVSLLVAVITHKEKSHISNPWTSSPRTICPLLMGLVILSISCFTPKSFRHSPKQSKSLPQNFGLQITCRVRSMETC